MSDNPFKSNLPEGFKTGIRHNPLKTEAQKKAIAKQWEEYWAVPGNREAWYEAMSKGQDEEWLAKVTAKNQSQAQDPEWLAGQRQKAKAYYASLSDEEKKKWSQVQKDFWINMSDEEYAKRCAIIKERWDDDEFRERATAYTKVSGYGEMMSKRNKEIAQRPEMQEWYKKHGKEYSKKYKEDPKFRKRHLEGVEKRTKSKEWQATVKRNTIMTPDGEFESRKAAAEFYNVHPPVMNYRMKKNPDQYYYTNVTNGSTIKYSKKGK